MKENITKYTDPYATFDVWLEFEGPYETYLKHSVWITDGHEVQVMSFYKEEPYQVEMRNGRLATHWLFPGNGIDEKNPPLPPGIVSER